MLHTIHLTADVRNLTSLNVLRKDETTKVFALSDLMTSGPLRDREGLLHFDALREKYWLSLNSSGVELSKEILAEENYQGNVHIINQVSTLLSQNPEAKVIYWMAGNAVDVLGYFFVLHFLRTHYERLRVVNITGLPFLDDDFKMIFPERLAILNEKQLNKALNLARPVTASEMEVEGEEWKALREQEGLRILSGNRKIETKKYEHFDAAIKSAHKSGTKLQRTAQHIAQKSLQDFPFDFILWRLSQLDVASSTNVESSKPDTNSSK